ncbi:MAG: LysR family transcriptional regulator [Desulfobacteraceae bacterium]|nr:LysR family transcriptional regulator [Desulfobacteraceae bacterium]
MDIHRLVVFCKVIELQSFTKAAEAVLLTQPTVSEHIRALEESLGEKLIDRLGREILPTPAGKVLYQYAREIIGLRDKAVQALERFKGNLSGTLHIGASTIPGTYILPRLIGSFKARYPSIQITLRIASSGEVVQKILDGGVEFGMIGAKWDEKRIILEEAYSDELVLIVYPGHPWEGRESVSLEELAEIPFVLRERTSGTRIVMSRALEAAGLQASRLNIVAEMGSTEAVRQSVKAKIGITLISRYAVEEDLASGALIGVQLDDVRIHRPFYVAQRKNRELSPLCAAFLEHLRSDAGGETE